MDVRQGFMVGGTVPWRDAVATAGTEGFDFVELDMEQAFPPTETDVRAVRAAVDRHDLDLVAHLPFRLDPGSPHDGVREGACRTLETAIDVAADLGATKGVMHAKSDAYAETWGADHLRGCLYESVRRVSAYGAERGVEVCVENLKGEIGDASDFPALFAATDAAACLDTGHAHATGQVGADQAALLREYPERFSHVHLNDTRRDDEDEHLPVGLGYVDFEALVEAMAATDWRGTSTHESYYFDTAYAAPSKAAFDRLLENAG